MQTPLWRPVVLRHRGRGGIQESEEKFAHRRTFGSWSRFGSWQRGVGGGCWGCAPGVSVDARQHPAALWSPSLQQRNIGPRLCWGSEMLIQTQILGIFLWLWVRTLLGLPLVAQWSRIHLPMQETRVGSLGWEDSPGEGDDSPLQYSCLGNPIDRGAWWAKTLDTT